MTSGKASLTWGTFLAASILGASLGAACRGGNSNGYDNPNGPGSDGGDLDGSAQFSDGNPESGNPAIAPACNDAACACALAGGSWSGASCTLTENPGAVDPSTQGKLASGGTADSAFKLVYPYDATVFPRGLLPPTLQWNGTASDAVYVHVTASGLDYKGWFGPSNPGRATFSKPAWNAITLGTKATDTLKVEVTKISGGAVTGPAALSWKVAQGSLRGVIYYETYGSLILGGIASVGIMKIQPGASAPVPVVSGCGNVCHTASADGSTLVAGAGFMGLASASYDLKTTAVRKAQSDQSFVYGGLYPDGSIVMSSTNYRTWMNGPSKLYDTTSGAVIPAPGWDAVVTKAAMPAFSPDGTRLVFNHEDTGGGKSIAMMSFNNATKTFSGLVDLTSSPTSYLGWPVFTPDTKTVVYHAGSSELFETDADSDAGVASTGDLMAVDVASKTAVRLDKLDGYSGASSSYLPANDPDLNFAPTVLPEAVGGYFWVVFTSHRSYGNTLPSKDNGDQNGKLWVAAVDIGAAPGVDPSHPAFYLDGQEAPADNLRGFWVLNACKDDGNGCNSGDECCGGYCRPGPGGALMCTSNSGGCSNEYEKCTTSTDCCGAGSQCINGKCAAPPVR